MKIVCISAANTLLKGQNSTSSKVCDLIGEIISKTRSDIIIEKIRLAEYEIKACVLCGECSKVNKCVYDDAFNEIYSKLLGADAVFWVVPHYSPIPSKLLAVFEKINEILYAGWIADNTSVSPFSGRLTGIIGHGGMPGNEVNLKYYHDFLVTPVANTLKQFGFEITGLEGGFANGAVFGLKDENCIVASQDSVFPEIIQDWDIIGKAVAPLVKKVIEGG